MQKKSCLLIAIMSIICASFSYAQQAPKPTDEERIQNIKVKKAKLVEGLPKGTVSVLDTPYVENARVSTGALFGSAQNLDLYVPEGEGPFPLVIWIHGGGWHSGDKEIFGLNLAHLFVPAGFAVASVNYRLTKDQSPFPAQIEDCFSALVWLRKHAEQYHLNPDKVGVVGHSAGAHLAALMAVTGDTQVFFKDPSVSTKVQAAVLWSGPFDLDRENGCWPQGTFAWNPNDPFCKTFFPSGSYELELGKKASVPRYVHAGNPPMLIIHGEKDTLVVPAHSTTFYEALKKIGADATLRLVPEKGHADYLSYPLNQEALQFFTQKLK